MPFGIGSSIKKLGRSIDKERRRVGDRIEKDIKRTGRKLDEEIFQPIAEGLGLKLPKGTGFDAKDMEDPIFMQQVAAERARLGVLRGRMRRKFGLAGDPEARGGPVDLRERMKEMASSQTEAVAKAPSTGKKIKSIEEAIRNDISSMKRFI